MEISRVPCANPRPVVIWWLKRDLRVADNAALLGAMEAARRHEAGVVALWLLEPEDVAAPDFHVRRVKFVRECLSDLEGELAKRGVALALAEGNAAGLFERLCSTGLLREVYAHEETGVLWTYARDRSVGRLLKKHGVAWTEVPTNGVVRRLKSRDDWKDLYTERMLAPVLGAPREVQAGQAQAKVVWEDFAEMARQVGVPIQPVSEPTGPFATLASQASKGGQGGGEAQAHALLRGFSRTLRAGRYARNISNPTTATSTGSRLSPYLAFGSLSSKQVHAFLNALEFTSRDVEAYRSRLAWRCHFIQKHEDFPELEDREVNAALAGLREPMTETEIQAWEGGTTGLPLIDASLRSVRATGFLNFRMRAMLMSFATHLLLRDWRTPAWSLARAFLDYEPGIHFGQVQMQASVTGINTVRIYCPLVQARRYDPEAAFIRKWVPELRDVPVQAILAGNGLASGTKERGGYPEPIVDVVAARERARKFLYAKMKEADVQKAAGEVWKKLGSREKSQRARLRSKKAEKKPVQTLFDESEEETT
ncbi:MAG: deoxyribodipyrimidine photo-lyase [Silvanigrellales bacterium]|nr:deoxyribodipyrimidine photo-lyase [Silvanigrellales bacterium]